LQIKVDFEGADTDITIIGIGSKEFLGNQFNYCLFAMKMHGRP